MSGKREVYQGGAFWNPEKEGDSVHGVLVTVTEAKEEGGVKFSGYVGIDTGNGLILVNRVWLIEQALKEGFISIGEEVEITYQGKKDLKGGKRLMLLEVARYGKPKAGDKSKGK